MCLLSIVSFAQVGKFQAVDATAASGNSQAKALTELTYVNADITKEVGFGQGAPIDVRGLAYFPENVVAPIVGEAVTQIDVYVANNGNAGVVSTLKVCIWSDTTNACANPDYEQVVSNVANGWNEVTLDNPFTLSDGHVFIGYSVQGTGYILGSEDGAYVDPSKYGDMIVVPSGAVDHLSNYNFGDLGIKAYVGTVDNLDISLLSIEPNAYAAIGENDVKGVVKNNGAEAITSYDVSYTIDGTTNSSVYSVSGVSISTGETAEFTHNEALVFDEVGNHTLEITISNVNGGGETSLGDNVLSTDIEVLTVVYKRNVVYEEATGTWCGWCPRGHVGLNTMAHNVTDGTWIGIAAHSGDPMEVSGYATSLGISGYPSGKMNRKSEVDPGLETLEPAYETAKIGVPVVKVDIITQSWNQDSREFTADIAVNFANDYSSVNYNVAMIVLEDSVTGTSGYAQNNNYSGQYDLIDWDGTNWKNLPNPVPASQMVYNHVARQLLGGFTGVSNVIPSSVTYGTPYTHTFEGSIPSDQDEANIHFVAIVINNSTGEIENATQAHLIINDAITETTVADYKIYPNPTYGMLNIENAEGAAISVYSILGELVYQTESTSATTVINLSALQAGNYLVQIVKDNKVSTEKVVLTK